MTGNVARHWRLPLMLNIGVPEEACPLDRPDSKHDGEPGHG